MNSHQKLELLTEELKKYKLDLLTYGKSHDIDKAYSRSILTKKVVHDIDKMLRKVDK